MQHTACIDNVAAVIRQAKSVIAQFALPLIQPGIFACVMYVAAEHPAIGAVAVVVEHDRVVAQDQMVAVIIDLGIAADGCEVVHHV